MDWIRLYLIGSSLLGAAPAQVFQAETGAGAALEARCMSCHDVEFA